jgi:hypothetical protein
MQRRPSKFDPKKPHILIVNVGETLRDAMERQRLRTGYGGGFSVYFDRKSEPRASPAALASALS